MYNFIHKERESQEACQESVNHVTHGQKRANTR